ncbi:10 kDa chaperonin [Philodulcilactobacillus myokoensis]|uniref:Co-chaperonin GroES n=1 Tax=Philodulcilactobacillus myokoensis TaxID=2929573 RepID=A0A9W6ESU3_9LACO|nr:co-chaperone GroES [Philodulcilactobacillus myokoensis]GLB47150.1 10 kDa chaperonin [Philodulcilactobacillus myokoensis]
MLKPLGDRVVIERQEEENKTIGGIVLANNAKEKPQTGTVVAVGAGRTLDNGKTLEPSVKKGDKVLFDKYAGTSVKYDGKSYLVLHDKDLVAIVD